MKRWLLAALLLCATASAQTCVPGGGVTCTTHIGLWVLPFNYTNWNTPVNDNSQLIDNWSVTVLPLSGGTMTGNLILNADPTTGLQAATKNYVDTHVASGSFTLGSTAITLGTTTTAVTGLTIDGVTPTTMGFVDPTSSIQTQLNGKAASGVNSDITALAGLTTPLSVPQGGTGAATLTGYLKGSGTAAISASNQNLTIPAFIGSALASPTAPSGVPTTGTGPLVAGTYWAKVVALDSNGYTTPGGTESAAVTLSATGEIAWSWTAVTGAASYQIWVGTASGAENTFASVAGTTYTQTAALTGGTIPATNTTGSLVLAGTGQASTWNVTGQYQVNGAQIAASNLSNGVTGTGAVVLAGSPALTGVPTAPTPGSVISTTQIPTTAYVATYYAPLASPTFTGTATIPTLKLSGTNTMTHVPRAYPAWHQASGTSITTGATFGPIFWSGDGQTIERLTANFEGTTTCSVAPVIAVFTCTTVACASPTNIASLTTGTAAGGYDSGALSVTISSGVFFAAEFTAGTCSSKPAIDFAATVRTN